MAFAQRRNGAPRWHFVYLALAGFNLVTILLSISITQNLMGMYSDTVKRDGEWTSRVAGIQSLAELSQNVFSPVSQSLVSGDIATFVNDLKARLAGEIAVGGPDLAHSLTGLGLIDEYRLYLHPVVLGSGKPFFAGPRPPLRLTASDRIGEDVIRLTYVPA